MIQKLFTRLGRVYSFVMSLIVAAILGVTTWAFWGLYQDARLQGEFAKEGQLLSVTVDRAEHDQRTWRDILGNSAYLTFRYKGKAYTSRFVTDSTYVSDGDRIQLLYHPAYNALRQPRNDVRFDQSIRKSRLIGWTTIRSFTDENRLLLLCLILSAASFFLISGVIVTIVPIPFLQDIARLMLVAAVAVGAAFFTYDTYHYYQYYQRLKIDGREVAVRVMDTNRWSVGRGRGSRRTHWYRYEATIQYQAQERAIPISEADFETVKPNDTLKAYYNESVNDFMSINYGPDYWLVIVPAFFWLITILLIRSGFTSQPKKL
ncbi:hypothetical protein [Spirosoma arcticum]